MTKAVADTSLSTTCTQVRPLCIRHLPIRYPTLPAHHCRTGQLGRCARTKWGCSRPSSRSRSSGCSHRIREAGCSCLNGLSWGGSVGILVSNNMRFGICQRSFVIHSYNSGHKDTGLLAVDTRIMNDTKWAIYK